MFRCKYRKHPRRSNTSACSEIAGQPVSGLSLAANLSEVGKNLSRSRKKVHSPRSRLRRRLVPVDDPPRPVVVFRINVSKLSA